MKITLLTPYRQQAKRLGIRPKEQAEIERRLAENPESGEGLSRGRWKKRITLHAAGKRVLRVIYSYSKGKNEEDEGELELRAVYARKDWKWGGEQEAVRDIRGQAKGPRR